MGCGGINSGTGFVAKGFSPAGLDYHYGEHGWQFKSEGQMIGKNEFENKAKKLLNSNIGGNIEGFTDKDGRVYRYNRDNNTFAKANPTGMVITFYKPGNTKKEGYKYWKGQIDKYSMDFN